MHSHLATLKQITHKIIHEGIPMDDFESDYMREPSFSWNPPIHNTLTAVGKNDIDMTLTIVLKMLTLTLGTLP